MEVVVDADVRSDVDVTGVFKTNSVKFNHWSISTYHLSKYRKEIKPRNITITVRIFIHFVRDHYFR